MDIKTSLLSCMKTLDSVSVSGIGNMQKIAAVALTINQVLEQIPEPEQNEQEETNG